MQQMVRARIDAVTQAGVWVTAADVGRIGPLDAIGTATVGEPALLVRLSGTDMMLIC